MASENLNVGTSANSNDGDTLRAAFISVKKMFAEVYGQTYSEQGDLSGDVFKIKADKLQMTADAVSGDDGKVLTYDHATGSFTWETKFDGDITEIVAGAGLTGDATSGTSSLAVGAGTGISVNDNDVQIAIGGVGASELKVTGNGTAGQLLSSDGDGTMTWADAASGGYVANYVTGAVTLWSDKTVYVFINTSDLIHTLPLTPSVGTSFKMSLRSTFTNTLERNGNLIMGLAEDLVLDNLSAAFELFYAGGSQGWVIIGAN
jgi:phage baseplate assembly protein gpV